MSDLGKARWPAAAAAVLVLGLLCSTCQDYLMADAPEPGEQPDVLAPTQVVEEFLQRTAQASDILFLVDDSGSMGGEQENLINNLSHFAQFLFDSDVDFHIGVVRIGLENEAHDGQLDGTLTYVDPDTSDGLSAVLTTIEELGTEGGSTCESGLQAAYLALTDPLLNDWNDGFYRENALLSLIVITDENDNASHYLCDYPSANPYEWVPWVQGLKRDPEMVSFGVIAGFSPDDNVTPADCESDQLGMADAAAAYWLANTLMGGISWSICNPDWSAVLTDLGLAASGLTRQFNLTRIPEWDEDDWDGDGRLDEPVLEVYLDRQDGDGFVLVEPLWSDPPGGDNPWEFDRGLNAVVFTVDTMPQEGWVLRAVYPDSAES